jgi:hypothetical protein
VLRAIFGEGAFAIPFEGVCPAYLPTKCPSLFTFGGVAHEYACFDTNTSSNHCGACGRACGPGEMCEQGRCVCLAQSLAYATCPDATELRSAEATLVCLVRGMCDGACTTLCLYCPTSSPGSLERTCSSVCKASQALACPQCPQGFTQCRNSSFAEGFYCVDTTIASDNCGACFSPCSTIEKCVNGKCQAAIMPTGECNSHNRSVGHQRCIPCLILRLSQPSNATSKPAI